VKAFLALSILLAGVSGCGMVKDEPTSKEVDDTVKDVEYKVKESRTLSSLAKIETSIAAYIEHEKKIPANLEALVPSYLAEIPTVELGMVRHRDTTDVRTYPASVLRDGAVDGSKLRDSGKWGYVHNERQVVIFVDCTHLTSGGLPWYRARGVY
jgi:hypothetical protein